MKIRRPHWRKLTWVVLSFNVLMLVWIVAGIAATAHPHNCGSLTAQLCQSANDAGRSIGVMALAVLWAIGDVILGTIYIVTGRQRQVS